MNRTLQALRPEHVEEGSLALTFEDNRVLALLLGEHDAHLALIEHRLEVAITPRGNRISIRGERKQAEFARAVLLHLYAKAARGGDINRGEIDGAIPDGEAFN